MLDPYRVNVASIHFSLMLERDYQQVTAKVHGQIPKFMVIILQISRALHTHTYIYTIVKMKY